MPQFFFCSQREGFKYFFSSIHPLDVLMFYWENILEMFFTHPVKAFQLYILRTWEVHYTRIVTETEVVFRGREAKYALEIDLNEKGRNAEGFVSFVDRIDPGRSFRIDFTIEGTAILSCKDQNLLSVPLPKSQPAT